MSEAVVSSIVVTDEKLELALKYLSEGKTRFEAARALGYKEADGMDRYLRRRGYLWNIKTRVYEHSKDDVSNMNPINNTPSRVLKILTMLSKGIDGKDIAKYCKFKNHQELAMYMKNKGYVWDSDKERYIKKNVEVPYDELEENENIENGTDNVIYMNPEKVLATESIRTENNADILDILKDNKEKLFELLTPQKTIENRIPRYIIKGSPITKSIYISTEIDRMIKDFSTEKNVTQKEIFQVALVEFLRKYGYRKEIENLFSS
jgi:hypothetical protein